jgi:cyclohexa-1,5-dienecarbonyl-CoA hydratase
MKYILTEKKEEVITLILNRPPLNILNIEMMEEIINTFENLQSRNLKLVIIKAKGKAFCAGVDVEEHTQEKVDKMIKTFHKMFYSLNSIDCLTLSIVEGPALGGGCELAIFCDLCIAKSGAMFGQPEVKVGVLPPVAEVILPHLIGRNRTLEFLVTGESIEAQEAERIGLINKAYKEEEFEEKVADFIKKITSKSASVLRLIKKGVDKSLYLSVMKGIEEVEDIYLNELMKLEDPHEGLKAFLEKRKPIWKNK